MSKVEELLIALNQKNQERANSLLAHLSEGELRELLDKLPEGHPFSVLVKLALVKLQQAKSKHDGDSDLDTNLSRYRP